MEYTFVCECCYKIYVNNFCDLHKLCENCFDSFNNQKMDGRWSSCPRIRGSYFENSRDFIRSKLCTHDGNYCRKGAPQIIKISSFNGDDDIPELVQSITLK